MKKLIIITIVALIIILIGCFFFQGGPKSPQKIGEQSSSLSNIHDTIRSFVGH